MFMGQLNPQFLGTFHVHIRFCALITLSFFWKPNLTLEVKVKGCGAIRLALSKLGRIANERCISVTALIILIIWTWISFFEGSRHKHLPRHDFSNRRDLPRNFRQIAGL